jgi:hypothetical protein
VMSIRLIGVAIDALVGLVSVSVDQAGVRETYTSVAVGGDTSASCQYCVRVLIKGTHRRPWCLSFPLLGYFSSGSRVRAVGQRRASPTS